MVSILSFFIYFQHSRSIYSSFFIGEWLSSPNISKQYDCSVELLFYQINNNFGELTLSPLKLVNNDINNILSQDDFLFISGRLILKEIDEFIPDVFTLGIYRKETSDIFMLFSVDQILPNNIIQKMMEFSMPSVIKSCPELYSFYSKMTSISNNFNYDELMNNITQEDIDISLMENIYYSTLRGLSEDKIYLKKQAFIDRLQKYSYEKYFDRILEPDQKVEFPLIYLKIQQNHSLNVENNMNFYLDGLCIHKRKDIFKPNFFEIKVNQINAAPLIHECNIIIMNGILYILMAIFLIKKSNFDIKYTSKLEILFSISYDISFTYILRQYSQEILLIDDMLSYLLFTILIFRIILFLYNIVQLYNQYCKLPHSYFFLLRIRNKRKKNYLKLISICVFLYLIIKFQNLDKYPNLFVFSVSSILVFQVIFNLFNQKRSLNNTIYFISLNYMRYFEISFILYRKNYISLNYFSFLWISIQSLIIVLQSVFNLTLIKLDINKKISDDVDCPICYEKIMHLENNYYITPCNHVFHEDCLERWMNEQMTCPMCRANLPRKTKLELPKYKTNYFPFLI